MIGSSFALKSSFCVDMSKCFMEHLNVAQCAPVVVFSRFFGDIFDLGQALVLVAAAKKRLVPARDLHPE